MYDVATSNTSQWTTSSSSLQVWYGAIVAVCVTIGKNRNETLCWVSVGKVSNATQAAAIQMGNHDPTFTASDVFSNKTQPQTLITKLDKQ